MEDLTHLFVKNIEPKSPSTLLSEIMERNLSTPPRLTLYLHSGRQIHGELVQFGLDHQSMVAVIHSTDEEVSFVPLESIESLTIHRADEYFASPPTPVTQDRDTTVIAIDPEVQSRLKELSEQLTKNFGSTTSIDVRWETLPKGSLPKASILALAREAVATLIEISQERGSEMDLQRKIRKLRIQNSIVPLVGLEGSNLVIAANLNEGQTGRFKLEKLKSEIEGIL
jgi:hypothetical protein